MRTITIRFKIIDEEAASAFWEAAKNKTPVHGMIPTAMGWGDYFLERDVWRNHCLQIEKYLDKSHASGWELHELVQRFNEWTEHYLIRQELDTQSPKAPIKSIREE